MAERIGHRPKGLPKTGGRQKGTRNKVKVEHEAAVERTYAGLAAALGVSPDKLNQVSPLEAMALCLQWALQARDRAGILASAQALAPYLHGKQPMQVALSVTHQFADQDDHTLLIEAEALESRIKRLTSAGPVVSDASDLSD